MSNTYDGAFCENSQRLLIVNYFRESHFIRDLELASQDTSGDGILCKYLSFLRFPWDLLFLLDQRFNKKQEKSERLCGSFRTAAPSFRSAPPKLKKIHYKFTKEKDQITFSHMVSFCNTELTSSFEYVCK